ncbi:hypothetical protein B296_00055583 [Ensete ventricosum]|uniref:Uncharacterized protein n=1 Tax=Ensete ventricosum TaxID=4639 RepID=A0A426XZ00_ENSVE|nr:hypothetical protein B296_00055583 [Ensete ventricosum]
MFSHSVDSRGHLARKWFTVGGLLCAIAHSVGDRYVYRQVLVPTSSLSWATTSTRGLAIGNRPGRGLRPYRQPL